VAVGVAVGVAVAAGSSPLPPPANIHVEMTTPIKCEM
jgi:hypothetical protein